MTWTQTSSSADSASKTASGRAGQRRSGRARSSRALATTAVGLLALFVLVVVVEDLVVTRLSPLSHQVSEYANDPKLGWLMTIGFAAWALSLFISAAVGWEGSRRSASPGSSAVVSGLLVVAGVAMILTTLFHTQTVAGVIPHGRRLTISGRLHDVGSGVTTLAIFAAAVAVVWDRGRGWGRFRWVTASAVAAGVMVDIGLLVVGGGVGGLRERLLLAIGCGWQLALLRRLPDSCRRGSSAAT